MVHRHTSDICAASDCIKRKSREAIVCKQQVASCIQDAKTRLFIRDLTLSKLIGTRTQTLTPPEINCIICLSKILIRQAAYLIIGQVTDKVKHYHVSDRCDVTS